MFRSSGVCVGNGDLRLVESEGGYVVLDIERDRILKLNTVGGEIWKLLSAGDSESQIVQKIANQYAIDERRVAGDVRSLIGKIEQFHLSPGHSVLATQPAEKPHSPSGPSYPWYGQIGGDGEIPAPRSELVIAAFLGLAVFDLILFFSSLRALCVCVKTWPVRRTASPPGPNSIGEICSSVQRACVWYPKRALCLQRAAVTTCLLRVCGMAAEMLVGVRSIPFMAHAWVEVNGAVVNDWRGVKTFYRPLISQ